MKRLDDASNEPKPESGTPLRQTRSSQSPTVATRSFPLFSLFPLFSFYFPSFSLILHLFVHTFTFILHSTYPVPYMYPYSRTRTYITLHNTRRRRAYILKFTYDTNPVPYIPTATITRQPPLGILFALGHTTTASLIAQTYFTS